MNNRKGIYFYCEECGKEVYKTLTNYNRKKHHFCSSECATKYRVKNSNEVRSCEFCHSNFIVNKSSTQRFCSIDCQHEWQKTQTGELNKKYNRVKVKCDYCNKEFVIKKYKKDKNHFCSKDCKLKWFATVWSQNDEWKEKSRIRAVKLLKFNIATTETKPQILLNNLLNEMNINFENEKDFKYYSIDNYINDNLMIEVMGDYWHCNPIKFNQININHQLKAISRDKAKHTYIKNYYNSEILYLWEYDIINNINLCKSLITEYCNNNGVLSNYHSFNYHIENSKLILNKNIIYPYQAMDIEEYKQFIKIS